MNWRVELARAADRAFDRASKPDRKRLERAVDGLRTNPRPGGKLVKAIQLPHDEFLRLRVGDYRVLYEIFDRDHIVLIHGIVHRRDLEEWLRQRS